MLVTFDERFLIAVVLLKQEHNWPFNTILNYKSEDWYFIKDVFKNLNTVSMLKKYQNYSKC